MPSRVPLLERLGPLYVMVICILLSQSLEAFTARQIGFGIMGKMTLALTGLATLLIFIPTLLLRTRSFLFTVWVNLPFLCYTAIALCSTVWSITPSDTLKAAITLMCFHGVGLAMASVFSWRSIWVGIAWALLLLGAGSVLVIPYDGIMSGENAGAMRGLWMEKNAAGEACAIGALACAIVAIADRNPLYFLGTAFMLCCILLAKAMGAFATCFVALSFLIFTETIRRGPVRFFMGGWFAVSVVAVLGLIVATMGLEAAGILGKDTTLTGRTAIWPTVIDFIKERPLLGYGFQSFWEEGTVTKTTVMERANFEAHNAHNSYFEMMLGIGAVGSFFVWFGILRCIFQSSTALVGGSDARRFALPFLIFGLLLSLSESMLGDSAGLAAFVLGILVPKVALSHAISKGHFKG